MKLAFSTLACPTWDLETILARGKEYGFQGVELRGLGGELVVPKARAFVDQMEASIQRIKESGLSVCCLSSSVECVPKDKAHLGASLEELNLYLELAAKMGVSFVRIFGGSGRDGSTLEERLELGGQVLNAMSELAGERSVQLVLETHDAWCSTREVSALLKAADHPCVGVCWDIHHPYRASQEPPKVTWCTLFQNIWHVHIKDAKLAGKEGDQLCLVGEGDLPVKECLRVLKDGGYQGYYCLEWEKRWHSELAEPEDALPKYVEKMKAWARELAAP